MKQTITKGSAEWPILFRVQNTDTYLGPDMKTDKVFLEGGPSALLDTERPRVLFSGTRDLDDGLSVILPLLQALAKNPSKPVIITGLSIGTDTVVAKKALDLGLAVVAVLPSPLEDIYPACNRDLARRIAGTPGCALLSQFPEGDELTVMNFMARHKIMAMMADIMIIPFAKRKGGSLVMARLVSELDCRVFAVPGRPTDIRSEGCNDLISAGVAEIVTRNTLGYLEKCRVTHCR